MGKDHTLFALKEGHVRFERHRLSRHKWVHVEPTKGHVIHLIYQIVAVAAAASRVEGQNYAS
ncbi:hypothetical protein AXF42_Ash002345 [Apostasia shenzhenica]|uniref:Uncharacterized protein n=1 Tax=Apostasia shenzhenica TaxID=1088818 RepID=A0A2I0ANB4_9ASPA|nr:hypothetical protein AXF42_Ash002345 [Apostasia shenzhenica]